MYSAIKIFLLIGLNFYQVHSLEKMDVDFWLYTNENINKYEDMVFNGEKATLKSNTKFDPTRPTKVIAHGLGGGIKWYVTSFVRAYEKVGVDYNVIAINWKSIKPKKGNGWDVSLRNIGEYTAHFLQDLVKNHGLKIEDVHCIGFSFGSHVIGYTGLFVNQLGLGKIPRGTALDPVAKHGGVESAKANYGYVDVIHSSEKGLLDRLGHVDFYPNGGEKQPCACKNNKKPTCKGIKCQDWRDRNDHNRAPAYYEASILDPNYFVAWKCTLSFKKWKNAGVDRNCSPEDGLPMAHMGEWTTSFGFPEGIYYLTTNGKFPYSKDEMK